LHLQLIRNATLKLDYGGGTILIDPYLAPKHSLPSYTGKSPNPLVDLPMAIEAILAEVELVVVSHLHSDHFDSVAKQVVPKGLPLICQPGDEEAIRKAGFTDVTPLIDDIAWRGVSFMRSEGSHGLGQVVEKMGSVMGFVMRAPGEPTIYWAGDTVLYAPVAETIRQVKPDIIVTHSSGALWDGDPIVMDAAETIEICRIASPAAVVIATHMEALDHATVDRQALRQAATAAGITERRLRTPADGETLSFEASTF
jgi:L-ascorbate metabolism protein UlaG (beta-lactamase superfamily)